MFTIIYTYLILVILKRYNDIKKIEIKININNSIVTVKRTEEY